MSPSLLESQLASLEVPTSAECHIVVDVDDGDVNAVTDAVIVKLDAM